MSLPSDRNLLAEYPNEVYVESGLWRGDSIQTAMDAKSFNEYYSIEIDPENITFAKNRFDLFRKPKQNLHLILGDSAEMLWSVIRNIDTPMTFFLDSHYSLLEGEVKGKNPFPLLAEIAQIARHPLADKCTILIDDILVLTHPNVTGWTRDTIEDELMKINLYGDFTYISNPVVENFLIFTP